MRESREHSAGLTPGRAARERFYPQLVYQHMSESRPRSCTERDSAGRAREFVEGESCSGARGCCERPAAALPRSRGHHCETSRRCNRRQRRQRKSRPRKVAFAGTFWSRRSESNRGPHHYELTFAVICRGFLLLTSPVSAYLSTTCRSADGTLMALLHGHLREQVAGLALWQGAPLQRCAAGCRSSASLRDEEATRQPAVTSRRKPGPPFGVGNPLPHRAPAWRHE